MPSQYEPSPQSDEPVSGRAATCRKLSLIAWRAGHAALYLGVAWMMGAGLHRQLRLLALESGEAALYRLAAGLPAALLCLYLLHPVAGRRPPRRRPPSDPPPAEQRLSPRTRLARAMAAPLMIAPSLLLFVGVEPSLPTVYVVNGLDIPVALQVGSRRLLVPARRTWVADAEPSSSAAVLTRATSGAPIERLTVGPLEREQTYVYNIARGAALSAATVSVPTPAHTTRWQRLAPDQFLAGPRIAGGSAWGPLPRVDSSPDTADGDAWSSAAVVTAPDAREAMVVAHLRTTPVEDPHWLHWAAVAGRERPGAAEVVAELRQTHPESLAVRLAELSLVSETEREALERGYREAARAAPDDPDRLFLSLYARPISHETMDEVLLAYERFPRHPALRWLAADTHARRGAWARAQRLLTPSLWAPTAGFYPLNARALARIRRARTEDPTTSVADLEKPGDCLGLTYVDELSLARWGMYVARPARVFARGRDRLAVRPVFFTDEHSRLRHIRDAASGSVPLRADLAGEEALREARALAPNEGLDAGSFARAIASASREGWPTAPLYDAAREQVDITTVERLRRVLSLVSRIPGEVPPDRLDASLEGSSPRLRGQLLEAACLRLGSRAPEAWRRLAFLLLFAPERRLGVPARWRQRLHREPIAY